MGERPREPGTYVGGAVGFRHGALTLLADRNTLLEALASGSDPRMPWNPAAGIRKKLGMPWRRSGLAVAGLKDQKSFSHSWIVS